MAMSTNAGTRWRNPATVIPGSRPDRRGTATSTVAKSGGVPVGNTRPVQVSGRLAHRSADLAMKSNSSLLVTSGASNMGVWPTPGSSLIRAFGTASYWCADGTSGRRPDPAADHFVRTSQPQKRA